MSDTKIELPATFKIDSVDAVYGELKASLDGAAAITVDGSAVNVVDFAGLQVLMAFARHCASASRDVSFANLSESLSTAITDTGAGDILGVG